MPAIVDEINVVFNADISRFTSGLNQVESQMNRANTAMGSTGNSLRGLLATVGLVAIGDQVKNFAESAIQASANLDSMREAFTSLTGNAKEADAILTAIQAGDWGLPLQNVEDMTKGMLAVGMSGQQALYSVNAVNDAATALGLGASGAETISNAIDKIALTGKVSALNMRPIVAQHIDAWRMLADYLNVSIPQAEEMVKKGAVSAQEGIAALTQGMTKEYADGAAKQMDTINGLFVKLKNNITVIMSGLGDQIRKSITFGPILEDVVNFTNSLKILVLSGMSVTDALNKLIPPGVKDIIEGLAFAIGSLLVGALLESAAGFIANTIAAAPFIAAGLVIVGTIYVLYTNWSRLNDIVKVVGLGIIALTAYNVLLSNSIKEIIADTLAEAAAWIVANPYLAAAIAAVVGLIAAYELLKGTGSTVAALFGNVAIYISDAATRLENRVRSGFAGLAIDVGNLWLGVISSLRNFVAMIGPLADQYGGTLDSWANSVRNWQSNLIRYQGELTQSTSSAIQNQIALTGIMGDQMSSIGDQVVANLKKIISSVTDLFKLPNIKLPNLKDLVKDLGAPPIDFSKYADAAAKAGKAVKETHEQMASAAEILDEQMKSLNDQLEIWRINSGLSTDSTEYLAKKIQVLGNEQAVASEKVKVLGQALVDTAAAYGTLSQKYIQGESALLTAESDMAKLTEEIQNTKQALDDVNASMATDQIKVINNALEIWRIQNNQTTDSVAYLNKEIQFLGMEQKQALANIVALNDKLNEIPSNAENASKAIADANASVSDAELQYWKLTEQIKALKDQLSGVSSGPQWVQFTANVKGLARAIDDASMTKGKLETTFTLPSGASAQAMGQSFGANLTQGFQDGMQAHSPSLIERTLMAISDQAKKTFSDLMMLGIAFTSLGSKMTAVVPALMVNSPGSNITTSPTIGLTGKPGVGTAAGMTTATGTAPGQNVASPAGQGLITVQQLVVREEADLQRIARLLFRMQQNQLRPKGITP